MWLPLAAFLFAGIDDDSRLHMIYINRMFMLIVVPLSLSTLDFAGFHLRDMMAVWLRICMAIVGAPNMMCRSFIKPHLTEEHKETGILVAYEEITINAAMAYIIPLYFIFVRHDRSSLKIIVPGLNLTLMLATTYAVWNTVEAGLVEIEIFVLCFKTLAFISLLFCAPHFLPGVSVHGSVMLLKFFIAVVIPLALAAISLLVQHEIASIDTITTKVDGYKYHLGVFYLMFYGWETLLPLFVNCHD